MSIRDDKINGGDCSSDVGAIIMLLALCVLAALPAICACTLGVMLP